MLQIARRIPWCLEEHLLLALDSILPPPINRLSEAFNRFGSLVLFGVPSVALTCGCLVPDHAVRGLGGNHGVHGARVSPAA